MDSAWAEPYRYQRGLLRINWLTHRSIFDFDRVELIRATDENIKRLAMRVGNDTDSFRRPRYKQMQSAIKPACQLSENTLRILQMTFGRVKQG